MSVTWEDAKAYCDWLSKTHGRVVRLPSEAEWEYAARGGLQGRRFPDGDTLTTRDANYASRGAVTVASYPPNGYGLDDMAGNVSEWVADWYDPNYYRVSPAAILEIQRLERMRFSGAPIAAAGGAWEKTGLAWPRAMPGQDRGTQAARLIASAFGPWWRPHERPSETNHALSGATDPWLN